MTSTKLDVYNTKIVAQKMQLEKKTSNKVSSVSRDYSKKKNLSFHIEPSPSSTSTCQCCNDLIEVGEIRVGELVKNTYTVQVSFYSWNHLACFDIKGFKHSQYPARVASGGLDTLSADQVKAVIRHFGRNPFKQVCTHNIILTHVFFLVLSFVYFLF
jgi:hypothetical protein